MKKISLIICFLFFTLLKAQNTTYQTSQEQQNQQTNQNINTEFKTKMDALFGQLEKNRIPHGILLDFGMEFTNVNAYNGIITDSTYTDAYRLKQIYNTLLSSRIHNVSDGFVSPQEFNNRWKNNRQETGVVSISGLFFKYAQFDNNALNNNKITHSNNSFHDKYTNGIWQNPYQEKQTFAMSPAIKKFKGYNLQVKIPANIFYTNAQTEIQSIEIDFNNGQGYVIVPFDQNTEVNYTTEGIKTWSYKLTLTNGTTLLNQSRIIIKQGLNTKPYVQHRANQTNQNNQQTNQNQLLSHTITATIPYANGFGSVSLTIDDALSNGAGIRKPLIVAEGFDVGTFFGAENGNGSSDYSNFQTSLIPSGSTLKNLIYYNNSQEYDIIYVDWNNGTDYMQRNAFALEAVIKWVNQEKLANGSTEPNVILGQSMGGVIARYALADMEERGETHDTRLFISQDAPQQGANMPVGFQYFARHIENQYVATSQTLFGGLITIPIIDNNVDLPIGLLNRPASKQLIKNWSNSNYEISNTAHINFYNELKGLNANNGYPINCRNVAISNGSECGTTQDFNEGSYLFNFQQNNSISFLQSLIVPFASALGSYFIDEDLAGVSLVSLIPGSSRYIIDFKANALYGTQGNRIYKGRIAYHKKVFWLFTITVNITDVSKNQPSELLPFDTYGGGYYPMRNVANSLPSGAFINDKFSFIPTVSALDIGKNNVSLNYSDYLKEYVGANPPTGVKESPFINFSTEFNNSNQNAHNKEHITFNRRNGDWLAGELNGGNAIEFTDCSSFCSGNFDFEIVGNDVICENGCDYTLNNSNGFNTIWSIIEGNNLVNASINGNSINLSQIDTDQNGFITLQSEIENYDCGNKITTKRIWVGKPSYPQDFTAASMNFPDSPTNYLLELVKPTLGNTNQGDVLDREYQIFPSNMIVSQDQWSFIIRTPSNTGIYLDYSYRYENQCGWSEWSYVHGITIDSGNNHWGKAEPYPNSSDVGFKIDLSDKSATSQFHIYLFDQFQNIMYQGQCNNVDKTIDTLNLQDGIYYLHLYENGILKTKQIIVGH